VTLLKNAAGGFEADLRGGPLPRLHLSLRTKRRAEAETLHAALVQFRLEGDRALDALLRQRKGGITVQQLAKCVRERRPFTSLLPSAQWPTVADAADQYADWLDAHAEREARTGRTARHQLAHYVADFGALPLDGVSPSAADAWQASITARFAVNSARAIITRVVALYAWHAGREARSARGVTGPQRPPRALHCPLDAETRPTRTTRRERHLSREEATKLVAATPAALLPYVGCGLLAGLRIDEVAHLRPDVDVDLARDMLVIQARGEKGQAGYWRPKNGRRRDVPITADLRTLLETQLRERASEHYVFPGLTNGAQPLHHNRVREAFQPSVEAAGLIYGRGDPQGVVFHTLRHTFASWLVAADVNPYRVAKLLGNSLTMVENCYGHLAPTDNRAAVALMSGVLPFPQSEDVV
jgi:integrase